MGKSYLFILSLGITCIIAGCKKSATGDTGCSGSYSFQTDIRPIFLQSCDGVGCHDGSLNGLIPLRTYAEITVVLDSVKSDIETGRMPPNQPMALADKQAVMCWINGGAPNN